MKGVFIIFIILVFYTSCTSFEIIQDEIKTSIENDIQIVQISDLHINKDKKIYRDLVEKINNINPDILLITGDSIDKKENIHLLDNFLKKLNPNIIKFAILGNWEHWSSLDINKLENIYKENRVELLVNRSKSITINEVTLKIFGTDDYTAGKPSLENFEFNNNSINIVMTHSPGYFNYLIKKFPNSSILVFSGHTHGGQVTFFGKPIFVPQGSGEYLKGIYIKSNNKLYVSKGIGNSKYDFRLFAKPDIIKVILE